MEEQTVKTPREIGREIAAYFKDVNNITEQELGMYMLGAKVQTPEEIGGALND